MVLENRHLVTIVVIIDSSRNINGRQTLVGERELRLSHCHWGKGVRDCSRALTVADSISHSIYIRPMSCCFKAVVH